MDFPGIGENDGRSSIYHSERIRKRKRFSGRTNNLNKGIQIKIIQSVHQVVQGYLFIGCLMGSLKMWLDSDCAIMHWKAVVNVLKCSGINFDSKRKTLNISKKVLNNVLKKKHLIMLQKETSVSSLDNESEIENLIETN